MKKLTKVIVVNHNDAESEVKFYFGDTYEVIWFYEGMTGRQVLIQLSAFITRIAQTYLN